MPCFSAASTAGHRSGMPRDTSHRQPVRARASSSCASLLGRPRRHIAATALAASGLTRIISRTARITACSACLAPIAPSPPAACPESAAILRPGPAPPAGTADQSPAGGARITGPIRRRSISQTAAGAPTSPLPFDRRRVRRTAHGHHAAECAELDWADARGNGYSRRHAARSRARRPLLRRSASA